MLDMQHKLSNFVLCCTTLHQCTTMLHNCTCTTVVQICCSTKLPVLHLKLPNFWQVKQRNC